MITVLFLLVKRQLLYHRARRGNNKRNDLLLSQIGETGTGRSVEFYPHTCCVDSRFFPAKSLHLYIMNRRLANMGYRRHTYWNKIFGNIFDLSIIHPARERRAPIRTATTKTQYANNLPKQDTQHQKIMGNSILIIDDEPDICRLLQLNLSKYGYKVKYVHALAEGWLFLKSHPTDVLFLDIHLPDGSGLEALPRIKQLYPTLQVITISAYDNGLEKEKALTAGAAHFLPKPFNVGKLQEIITDVKTEN
jgi:CheY-like chemotaxis protein